MDALEEGIVRTGLLEGLTRALEHREAREARARDAVDAGRLFANDTVAERLDGFGADARLSRASFEVTLTIFPPSSVTSTVKGAMRPITFSLYTPSLGAALACAATSARPRATESSFLACSMVFSFLRVRTDEEAALWAILSRRPA